jgi:predicted nucleic acid-binding protein
MTAFVIDASTVLAWCFEEDSSGTTDAVIDLVAAKGAAVPSLWSLEVANALVLAERRGRIMPAESAAFVAMIEEMPIEVDRATHARALRETIALARQLKLTAYDAAYLELAMRLNIPLVTGDNALRKAAQRQGVSTTPA